MHRLKKSKKGSPASTDRHSTQDSLNLSIDSSLDPHTKGEASPVLTRSISAATRHLHDDDQLTVKGRYLLGKYYNGPTQWLAPGAKLKGKQVNKKT